MISVIYKKPGFLNTLQYVLGKERTNIVDSNMQGKKPEDFNEQFLATKYCNKEVKNQCAHIILSIAHTDIKHESLNNSEFRYAVREFLTDMGFLNKDGNSDSQYVAARHHDRDHEHLHIVASRIRLDGSCVRDSFDYFNSQVSTRRISAELGLEITPTTNQGIADRLKQEYGIIVPISPNRSKSIRAVNSKHKTPTSKEIIKEAIGEAIKDSPTVSTFIERLEEKNISVLPKIKGSELLGFSYLHNGVQIAGNQVYKPYSWTKLQSEYGITYDPEKDKINLHKTRFKTLLFINDKKNSDSSSDTNQSLINNNNKTVTQNQSLEITPIFSQLDLINKTKKTEKKEYNKFNIPDNKVSVTPPQESDNAIKEVEDTNSNNSEINLSLVENLRLLDQTKDNSTKKENKNIEVAESNYSKPSSSSQDSNIPHSEIKISNQDDSSADAEENIEPVQEIIAQPQFELLDAELQHLPKIITDYMLAANSPVLRGKEVTATLDGNTLTLKRNGENNPIIEAVLDNESWYTISEPKLTEYDIEQIESLQHYMQHTLSKNQTNQDFSA
ncbi:MAG: relaxase/mobilization nuclease domain-containing protein [Scytonematopsis contorta HA4267-MV1]|jgi:hypothetical protein|nr:relaxase/mobilization nuclease domain-containing protein [Scytonematopsis contorta HA4267-MV1]